MYETEFVKCKYPVTWKQRFNPLWWLVGGAGWVVPDENNGSPYNPTWPKWLRYFVWFGFRNPLMNFVGYVIGIEGFDFYQTGPAPVSMTTWADANPPAPGWKCAYLRTTKPNWMWVMSLVVYAGLTLFVSWWFLPALLFSIPLAIGVLPFLSHSGSIEWYFGWRPNTGGFGIKIVKGRVGRPQHG